MLPLVTLSRTFTPIETGEPLGNDPSFLFGMWTNQRQGCSQRTIQLSPSALSSFPLPSALSLVLESLPKRHRTVCAETSRLITGSAYGSVRRRSSCRRCPALVLLLLRHLLVQVVIARRLVHIFSGGHGASLLRDHAETVFGPCTRKTLIRALLLSTT